jgi:acyl carrier protein
MHEDRSGRRSTKQQHAAPIHFDATQRRRDRLRNGGSVSTPPTDAKQVSSPPAARTVAARVPAAPQPGLPRPAAPKPTEPAPQKRRSTEELSSFLVNFVVEQTGYPPEIVELDADLEADLGIDSIKKAQLFGEIGEYFAIPPRADLALDDFPTLRHVLGFLIEAVGSPSTPAPVATPTTAVAAVSRNGHSTIANGHVANGHVATEDAAAATATVGHRKGRSEEELSAFLVNFVVEQTGYPPEIVELDADLEADLGIDSIKKAQLFGEIGEYFAIPPRADLALDDFPTLRHVLGFLIEATA